MDKIDKLLKIINESDNIVVITGAGISTESGIPDFRSKNGLYNQIDINLEEILSIDYFNKNPLEFYNQFLNIFKYTDKEPTTAHKFLYDLEKLEKLKLIVTQNVDGLHQKAGNNNVIEIHGNLQKNRCTCCGTEYSIDYLKETPFCGCGSIIRPGTLLYGEMYDSHDFVTASKAFSFADVLMILGTSVSVYGIVNLIDKYPKDKIVVLNRDAISIEQTVNVMGEKMTFDRTPILSIHDELGTIFNQIELDSKTKVFKKI